MPLLLAQLTVMLACAHRARARRVPHRRARVQVVAGRWCRRSRLRRKPAILFLQRPVRLPDARPRLSRPGSSTSCSSRSTSPSRGRNGPFVLALACIGALVVTHHLTSWLDRGLPRLWAQSGCSRRAPGRGARRGDRGRRGLVVAAAWTALVGRRLVSYLSPIFSTALSGIASALDQLRGNRHLFHTAAGAADPTWEIVTILAAAVFWCLILLPSAYAAIRQGTVRGGEAAPRAGRHRRHLPVRSGNERVLEQLAGRRRGQPRPSSSASQSSSAGGSPRRLSARSPVHGAGRERSRWRRSASSGA